MVSFYISINSIIFYAALDITAVNKEGVTAKMLIDMYIKFVHLRSLHCTHL